MCTVAPPLAASIAAFEQMSSEQQVLALDLLSRLVQSGHARPAARRSALPPAREPLPPMPPWATLGEQEGSQPCKR